MYGIYRRFGSRVVNTNNSHPVSICGATLNLNKQAELYCSIGGSSYIICDDVYAFTIDEDSIWYMLRNDVAQGNDIVYKLETHDVFCRKKGFFDKENNFIFERDGVLYVENSSGFTYKLCSVESLVLFLGKRKDKCVISINQIERILYCQEYANGYSETEFYKDISCLHKMIARLSDEKNMGQYTSDISAQIIWKVLQICCRMNKDAVKPLSEMVNKEIYEQDRRD